VTDLPDQIRTRLDQLPDLATSDLTTSVITDTATDTTAIRIDQPLATHQIVGHFAVPAELLQDTAPDIAALVTAMLDRRLRPWRYPDPPAFPPIALFPGLARWLDRWASIRTRWHR
jgi:hypothetical protein